jgi:hypothetical protein
MSAFTRSFSNVEASRKACQGSIFNAIYMYKLLAFTIFSILTASNVWPSLPYGYFIKPAPQIPLSRQQILGLNSEIGICATNSGSPEVELRFLSMIHIFSNIELGGLT